MDEYTLFRNMKRWLILYGIQLLDLLHPVENADEIDPIKRYENLAALFDKHFNLMAYYGMQVEPHLPLILVSFTDLTGNSCFPKYRVTFDVYFQTISPQDCKDNEVIICNSPECILDYREKINQALCELMYNMDKDMRIQMFDGKPWEYPLNYDVIGMTQGELTGMSGDEILHFQTSFDLSDNISNC